MELVRHHLGQQDGQDTGSKAGDDHGPVLQVVGPDPQEHGRQDVGHQGQIQVDQPGGVATEGVGDGPYHHAQEIQAQGFLVGPVFFFILEGGQIQGKGLIGGAVGKEGGVQAGFPGNQRGQGGREQGVSQVHHQDGQGDGDHDADRSQGAEETGGSVTALIVFGQDGGKELHGAHAQQGADDEEGDEDVQEAVAVDPAVGDVGDALGQEVEVLEQTGSEEAEHCAAAEELVPDGQALADLTDQDAEGEQDGDRADHLVGDDVEVGAGQHDDGEKRIDGKRHSIELNGIQFFHCCFLLRK